MEQTIVTHQQVKQAFENYLKLLYSELEQTQTTEQQLNQAWDNYSALRESDTATRTECEAAFAEYYRLLCAWESRFLRGLEPWPEY